MSYATQTSVEGILGRSLSTSEASALPALLAAIDEYINEQTGRKFTTATEETRYFDIERSRIIDVDPFFTDSTHAFTVSYVDEDETIIETVDSSDYEARPRNENIKTYLQRRSTVWGSNCPHNVANLAVKAFFGYDSVPADIVYVASWLAAQSIGSTNSLSLKSESIEGYSRTFATFTESSPMIKSTFDKYQEVLL